MSNNILLSSPILAQITYLAKIKEVEENNCFLPPQGTLTPAKSTRIPFSVRLKIRKKHDIQSAMTKC